MKTRVAISFAVLFTVVGTAINAAPSLEKCNEAVARFKRLGNVSQMLDESFGYAVLPTIG